MRNLSDYTARPRVQSGTDLDLVLEEAHELLLVVDKDLYVVGRV